jgi:pyrroline-5-carboxylate reductase
MTEKGKSIALIGSGAMGEAAIVGLLTKNFTAPENIHASDPVTARLTDLHQRYGITPHADNNSAVQGADLVLLAVKPQKLDKVLNGLRNQIPEEALVLSIIAGATIQTISEGLNHDAIVRAMPNTPAQIGQGITVWTSSPAVSPQQAELARQVLSALGQEIFMEEEYYLDMATALSGTGPGYVFLFMEALIDAGVHMGFPRRIAEQLVTQTILGSVSYYEKNGIHPAQLRNQVTSPGGTTAEALYYLDKAGFRTAISRAVWAAFERSQELGKGMNSKPPEKL